MVTEVRHTRLHGVPHAGQVDIQRAPPNLLGQLPRRRTGGIDARIGDDDIEPAEFGDSRVDRRGHRLEHRDVGEPRHAAPAALLHFGCSVAQFVGRRGHVDRDHIGTFVGEPFTVHASHPPGGAGDDHDLVNQSGHQGALISPKPL